MDKKLIILEKVKKEGLKAYLVGNDGIEKVEAGFKGSDWYDRDWTK